MKSNPSRSWDFPAAALIMVTLLLSAIRLVATKWTTGLEITLTLTILGVTLGMMLGVSRIRPIIASLLSFVYSLVALPWVIGAEFYEDITWLERLASILGRLWNSLELFVHKKPVDDTLMFILMVALIYWCISLLAGYQWSRHENMVGTLLPTWVILVLIQVYDNIQYNRIIFVIFCMFFSLLLLGRRFILQKRRFWKENHIHSSADSHKEMNLTLVIYASAILLLAWVIPAPTRPVLIAQYAWDRISEPWQNARKDLGNAVAGLEGTSSSSTHDYYNSDLLELGQRAITGNTTIFNVEIPSDPVVERYYWRVRVYDEYSNGQWTNSKHSSQGLSPSMPALQLPTILTSDAGLPDPSEFTFSVSQGRIFNLFTPAQTVWISRPVQVSLFRVGDDLVDPILIQVDNIIHAGESYQVKAIESNPTILELRQAGEEYPDWVLRHYLQVPSNLSSKLSTLAARLVSEKDTVFDKATAITSYLRREITYSKVVSRPPFGADILAWFLLDYKQGYCNYSATAEVILLRLAGIPARLVVGFAQGERVPGQRNVLTVKQNDAHAWPEVYFPGIGWVEFEPTSSQEGITRPSGIAPEFSINPIPAALARPDLEDEIATRQPFKPTTVPEIDILPSGNDDQVGAPGIVVVLFGLLIVGLSGFLLWRGQQRQRSIPTPLPVRMKLILERNSLTVPDWLLKWVILASEDPIQKYFKVIHKSLQRFHKAASQADTPMQACSALMECLPEATSEIIILRDEYQKYLFSQETEDAGSARSASLTIRRLTNRAVFHNYFNRFFKKELKDEIV